MARAGHHRQILLKYLYRNHGTYHGDYAWDYRGYGDYRGYRDYKDYGGYRGIKGTTGTTDTSQTTGIMHNHNCCTR